MAKSKITITFTEDLEIGDKMGFSINNTGAFGGFPITYDHLFTWVATRADSYEVTTGTATGIPGENTAINFAAAAELDTLVDSITRVDNVVTIFANENSYLYGNSSFVTPVTYFDPLEEELVTVPNHASIETDIVNAPPYSDEENSVSPDELEFNIDASIPGALPKIIEIVADTDWAITSDLPDWIEPSALSGSGNTTLTMTPVSYSGLAVGEYTHNLIIEIEEVEFEVLITLKIYNVILNPYNVDPAFTLDNKNFTIQGANTNTYFQFDSTITTYDFHTNEEKIRFIPQKILLYKGKSEINIGRLVHRLMQGFYIINDNLNQYKFAKLDIVCKEMGLIGDGIISTITLDTINFVAGISKNFSNFGFLEMNPKKTRITTQGYYYLNILIPDGNYELRTYKNGTLINTETLPNVSTGPICKKVVFNDYNQGDSIDFKIDIVGGASENPPTKSFYVFPNQHFSNMIIWENEFLLKSVLECTNEHDIKSEIERITGKRIRNGVEKTEHFSVTKDSKLTINTGWVTKNDIDSIDSLLMNKRAFMPMGDKIVDLVPISKTFSNYDSKEELYDYTIEFTINKIYNEETYSF